MSLCSTVTPRTFPLCPSKSMLWRQIMSTVLFGNLNFNERVKVSSKLATDRHHEAHSASLLP